MPKEMRSRAEVHTAAVAVRFTPVKDNDPEFVIVVVVMFGIETASVKAAPPESTIWALKDHELTLDPVCMLYRS